MIQGMEEGGHGGAEQNENNPMHQRCALGLFLLVKYKDRQPLLNGKMPAHTKKTYDCQNPSSSFYQKRISKFKNSPRAICSENSSDLKLKEDQEQRMKIYQNND